MAHFNGLRVLRPSLCLSCRDFCTRIGPTAASSARRRLSTLSTCDLSDKHGDAADVLDPIFRAYGGHLTFHGQIQTVKCFEDNSLVKKQLETPGHGRVLVVDGGGSTRRSLLGDENAALGIKNGCVVGLVVM